MCSDARKTSRSLPVSESGQSMSRITGQYEDEAIARTASSVDNGSRTAPQTNAQEARADSGDGGGARIWACQNPTLPPPPCMAFGMRTRNWIPQPSTKPGTRSIQFLGLPYNPLGSNEATTINSNNGMDSNGQTHSRRTSKRRHKVYVQNNLIKLLM